MQGSVVEGLSQTAAAVVVVAVVVVVVVVVMVATAAAVVSCQLPITYIQIRYRNHTVANFADK